jgi:hypothetical protein
LSGFKFTLEMGLVTTSVEGCVGAVAVAYTVPKSESSIYYLVRGIGYTCSLKGRAHQGGVGVQIAQVMLDAAT